jgi:putative PIG3 family NAD(P)H quinone oxidoreductase
LKDPRGSESMPSEQTVIVITAAGGPEVLESRRRPIPSPADHELLIRVHAAGINRHDVNQRRRGPGTAHSDVPGLEVAGVVAGIGTKLSGWTLGERVCALTDGGGYGEYAVAPAALSFRIPERLTDVLAAALPEALFTVWFNFFKVAQLAPAESVLLHGGTSGVGSIAIQLLAGLGHPVFATCGSDDKVLLAKQLGAREAFNYRSDTFAAGVRAATHGRGVDVILDMSGGRHSLRSLESLAYRGRIVHLSPGDGADFSVPLRLIMAKEAKITGSLLRPLALTDKTVIAEELRQRIWPTIDNGQIKPQVYRVLPLRQAAAAHAIMDTADHAGKVILNCRD